MEAATVETRRIVACSHGTHDWPFLPPLRLWSSWLRPFTCAQTEIN